MRKLGARTYGADKKESCVPRKLWEIQAGIEVLLEAGVLDKKMLFALVDSRGSYPVVLLHEDLSKWKPDKSKSKRCSAAEEAAELVWSQVEKCDIGWLLAADGSIEIAESAEGSLGTPVALLLSSLIYAKDAYAVDPLEDAGAWRIDFMQAMVPGEKTEVKSCKDIGGWAVFSAETGKMLMLFGKAGKIASFKLVEDV